MSNTIKCVIIDDEPLARELIRSYVEKTPHFELIGCFESAVEAVKTVMEGEIEFAGIIPQRSRIIYITAYEQFALEGFKVNALDYLLKPVSYPEFMKAAGKAVEWCAMRNAYSSPHKTQPRLLTVKADYKLVQMKIDSIKYIEVQKDRVVFYRTEGTPVSSLMSLTELEEMLPSERFMRVHRSYIVNLDQIEIVERSRIVFGKTYIPVSESRREEFLSRLGK